MIFSFFMIFTKNHIFKTNVKETMTVYKLLLMMLAGSFMGSCD
jgi:hypothetical protein